MEHHRKLKMKHHELIYALRQYTTHDQLAQILYWPNHLLEKLFDFYAELPPREIIGIPLDLSTGEMHYNELPPWYLEKFEKRKKYWEVQVHPIVERVGRPARKNYKVGDAILVEFPVGFIFDDKNQTS